TSARRGAAREVLMAPSRRPRGSRGRIGFDGRRKVACTVLVVRGGAAARAGDPDQGGERGGRVADDRDARGHGGAGLLARAYAGRTRAGRDPGGSERGTDARGAPAGRPDDPGGRADAPRAGVPERRAGDPPAPPAEPRVVQVPGPATPGANDRDGGRALLRCDEVGAAEGSGRGE